MRLILVTWHFPPANTIAAVRTGKLARHLLAAGHELRVLTVTPQLADLSLPLEIDERLVRRTPFLDVDALLDPRRWGGRTPARPAGGGTVAPAPSVAPPGWRQAMSRLYRGLAFFPDRQVGWGRYLLPALEELLASFRPDLVLVSGPPFSPFLWVARAAGRAGVPWVAEFRDRWANDSYTEIPPWRRPLDGWLERRVVGRAAGIVTVSAPWEGQFKERYGLPVATVMNGYDPADFAALEAAPARGLPLRVVHVGTVYRGRRDPSPLLRAVAEGGFRPDELRLVFYGHYLDWVGELARDLGVEPFVELCPPVPYRQALALQKAADLLLLLQWNAPGEEGNVPGKLFEYFAAGRPMLGLGPEAGVPARLIRERQAGLFSNEPAVIAARLRTWIEAKRATGAIAALPAEARLGLTREEQYGALERFLEEIRRPQPGMVASTSPRRSSHVAGRIG